LSAAEEFRLREQRKQEEEEEERRLAGQKPKREAWMTVPPTALDGMAHQDPTKITKRGFNQNGRRGAGAEKATEEGRSLWTETPEERAKRIDEEVMGKRKRIENASKQETDSQRQERKKREARDAHMRAQTDAYNVSGHSRCTACTDGVPNVQSPSIEPTTKRPTGHCVLARARRIEQWACHLYTPCELHSNCLSTLP
jgi:hypothetical protein